MKHGAGAKMLITFNGVTLTRAEWAARVGIRDDALRDRLLRGVPIERALTEPSAGKGGRRRPGVLGPSTPITHEGVTRARGEWAAMLGIQDRTLRERIARGVPLSVALTPDGAGCVPRTPSTAPRLTLPRVGARPHIWHNGSCLRCAMRPHWEGARHACEGFFTDKVVAGQAAEIMQRNGEAAE